MPPDLGHRAYVLFEEVIARPFEQRVAYLDQACRDDAALRRAVESLLAADAAAGRFLEQPGSSPAPSAAEARVGRHIGRYRIQRLIASGGMGAVYEAIQENPRRSVALKVLHGPALEPTAQRLEFESSVLARLQHPHIAQVFEAGTHDDDSGPLPYFTMEYISDARSITRYAREQCLGLKDRLRLFGTVCAAIAHGHQRGIIHRDIKPGNILVDATGQPKVIDFGVARVTQSDLAAATLHTSAGGPVGTLAYMSPEQCDADPGDTDVRSDVYALGVVLYELLCERLPYDLSATNLREAIRIIREQPPVPPHTVCRDLRGDLETIILRALEKDRDRRYPSVSDLAEDLACTLRTEPIAARRGNAWYVMTRMVQRHRLATGALCAFVVLLVAATILSTALWRRAEHQADRAREQERKAEQVSQFVQGILTSLDPQSGFLPAARQTVPIEVLLDAASRRVDEELRAQPEVAARSRHILGRIYLAYGYHEQAETELRSALALRAQIGTDHPVTGDNLIMLGWVLRAGGDCVSAESCFREAVSFHERIYGPRHGMVAWGLTGLASVLHEQYREAEAEVLFRRAADLYVELFGEGHQHVAWNRMAFGRFSLDCGRHAQAEQTFRSALATYRATRRTPHQDVADAMYQLAEALRLQHQVDEAERLFQEVVEMCRTLFDHEHRLASASLSRLASLDLENQRPEQARRRFEEALSISRRLAERPQATAYELNDYALLLVNTKWSDLRDPVAALNAATQAVERSGRNNARFLSTLADAYQQNGDHKQAISTQQQALSLLPEDDSPLRRSMLETLTFYRSVVEHEE